MGQRRRIISSDRVGIKRVPKNKIVIAVEGRCNKTEKQYFYHFDDGKKPYTISIANGNETDPVKLVKRLDAEIRKKELNLNGGDQAFCVFDVDTDANKNRLIEEAKNYAKSRGIQVITSTPSIELWFLLHFIETTAYYSNHALIKKLNQYIKYEKNNDIFPAIIEYVNVAIERAKKLEQYQIQNNKKVGSVDANPNTEMYKIVEYFLQYK